MPSVRAIAAHLKLSPATVSRVLNNHPDVDAKTRQRVLGRINATGYVPKVGRRVTNVIDGEVTDVHPHDETIQRGVMVEIDVASASAGDTVLFAGSKPLWLF